MVNRVFSFDQSKIVFLDTNILVDLILLKETNIGDSLHLKRKYRWLESLRAIISESKNYRFVIDEICLFELYAGIARNQALRRMYENGISMAYYNDAKRKIFSEEKDKIVGAISSFIEEYIKTEFIAVVRVSASKLDDILGITKFILESKLEKNDALLLYGFSVLEGKYFLTNDRTIVNMSKKNLEGQLNGKVVMHPETFIAEIS